MAFPKVKNFSRKRTEAGKPGFKKKQSKIMPALLSKKPFYWFLFLWTLCLLHYKAPRKTRVLLGQTSETHCSNWTGRAQGHARANISRCPIGSLVDGQFQEKDSREIMDALFSLWEVSWMASFRKNLRKIMDALFSL
ncbi:MAG: hypothetical protein VKM34_06175 [Cyanobacteriota bacterium]|nr:hypothetical protein [Cyanobacteriota bacterium]